MKKKTIIMASVFAAVVITVLLIMNGRGRTEKEEQITEDRETRAEGAQDMDLSAWTSAGIDWRQFEGSSLSVLADAQAGFMALRRQLPLFEALTGIEVGIDSVEQAKMREKREVDLSSGSGIYDVFPIGVTYLGTAYQNGWFEYLDPYLADPDLTDADWYDFSDISQNSITLCQIDGHLGSLPFDYSAPILFYRKDLFDKYGIPVPDSYEEVAEMKKSIQKALEDDGVSDVYGFAGRTRIGAGMNTWTVIPCIRSYGSDILDQKGQPIFNNPQGVRALEVYNDMSNGYGNPPDSRVLHFYDIRRMFREGKLASALLASHFFNEINTPEKSEIWDKWDAALTPRGPAARETSPWAWALSINSASKNKKAAWLFIQWATSKATAELLHDGGAPARLSTWDSEYYATMEQKGLIEAVKWILNEGTVSSIQAGVPEFPEVGDVISTAFSEIFYGAPVQKSLDDAAVKVESIMGN